MKTAEKQLYFLIFIGTIFASLSFKLKNRGGMRECNKNIECLIELSRKLLFCADRGDIQREDDSCGVLFGMARDCAYKILGMARKERDAHKQKGIWDGDENEQE